MRLLTLGYRSDTRSGLGVLWIFKNPDYYGFSTYSGGKWRGRITNPLFLLFAPFRQNFNSFLEPVNIEDFSPQILIWRSCDLCWWNIYIYIFTLNRDIYLQTGLDLPGILIRSYSTGWFSTGTVITRKLWNRKKTFTLKRSLQMVQWASGCTAIVHFT